MTSFRLTNGTFNDDTYAETFHGLDQVVVVAESADLETTKAFVRRLGTELQADTEHVLEVTYRIDTSSLDGKKLLLLSPSDLRTLHDNVADAHDVMEAVTKTPGVNSLLAAINRRISTAMASHLTRGIPWSRGTRTGHRAQAVTFGLSEDPPHPNEPGPRSRRVSLSVTVG